MKQGAFATGDQKLRTTAREERAATCRTFHHSLSRSYTPSAWRRPAPGQTSRMARIHDVVVDCRHPASLARFWAAALDGYAVAPYDEAELERLRAAGIDDVEDDPTVLVEAPGVEPRLFFQCVAEAKVVKNRVHLDLVC